MSNLSLKLNAFEGPLDLLLSFIDKDKIDIYDIPIVSITEQYMAYLRAMSEFDMEIASEFIVMAATLLQIKSRMLLPKQTAVEEDEEGDPRQMLVEMLLEYRRIKACATVLTEMKEANAQVFTREPYFAHSMRTSLAKYDFSVLLKALANITTKEGMQEAFITPQAFSVQEKMAEILELLQLKPQGIIFQELLTVEAKGEKIAAFLAILELLKDGRITVNQAAPFTPIYIFANEGDM